MCLQVLQWQYKIFKIPKCLSEIKKLTTTRQQPAWNMSPKNQTTFANLEISLQSLSKYRFLLRSTYSFQKMVWLWQFKNLFKNLKELPILVIPSGWNIEEKQKQENAIDEKKQADGELWQRASVNSPLSQPYHNMFTYYVYIVCLHIIAVIP